MSENERKSPQILNASTNLVGFCLVIITSLKALKLSGATFIDDLTAVATLFLITSVLFAFLAIRSTTERSRKYENLAEIFFLLGLLLIFATILLLTFDIIE